MFTGIVESLGMVTNIEVDRGNIDFTIQSKISSELKIDQSVSHNGVCLTVTKFSDDTHTVTAVKETLAKSSLKTFSVNDLINLERAMKLGDRLDGHLVQGHVDGVAKCVDVCINDGSWIYKFEFDISNEKFPFMTFQFVDYLNSKIRILRASFTGELGYEIYVQPKNALKLWERIFYFSRDVELMPYGTETMHLLRAEKGYIIVGQDLSLIHI